MLLTKTIVERSTRKLGESPSAFFDCVQMYLQTRFAFNAAELQRLYVLCGLKKSPKVNMHQFCKHMQVLNDVIEWLPMKYYSPQSTENTVKCKKFANPDMVWCIMHALPEAWQNDLLKSVQGNLPETVRELLPLLELIEKSLPTSAPRHESAK